MLRLAVRNRAVHPFLSIADGMHDGLAGDYVASTVVGLALLPLGVWFGA